jgi:hypothetical protein
VASTKPVQPDGDSSSSAPIRSTSGLPLWFLFELHDDPIYSHPLWLEWEQTVPCVRHDIRTKRAADGKFTWEPAQAPEELAASTMRALVRMIDGFSPHMGPRGRNFRWYMQPAAFGGKQTPDDQRQFPMGIPLLGHPGDALIDGRRGPFTHRGIDANRRIVDVFARSLAAGLRSHALPDPLAIILATENGPADDVQAHFGGPGALDRGWYPVALNDPRADDPAHAIDGVLTLREYHNQARSLDGLPVPECRFDVKGALWPGWHPENHECIERARATLRRAWEWSRYKGFVEPVKAAFARGPGQADRTPLIGEYLAASDSKAAPVPFRPGLDIHGMDGYWRSDLQCPTWYGDTPAQYPDHPLSDDHPGWDTLKNFKRALALDDTATAEEDGWNAGLELALRQARAHAQAAPHAPLAPFVQTVNARQRPFMMRYIRECQRLGAWGIIVFMPRPLREEHDFWLGVLDELARDKR